MKLEATERLRDHISFLCWPTATVGTRNSCSGRRSMTGAGLAPRWSDHPGTQVNHGPEGCFNLHRSASLMARRLAKNSIIGRCLRQISPFDGVMLLECSPFVRPTCSL